MKKNSFKSKWKLIRLIIFLFFSRLKIRILSNYLKKKGIMTKTNPYEEEKFYFGLRLMDFILEIKTGNSIDNLYKAYNDLLESRFLYYGVDNREFKAFLKSLEIPIPDEEKEEVVKHLIEKMDELIPMFE